MSTRRTDLYFIAAAGVAVVSTAHAGVGYEVTVDVEGVFDQAVVYTSLFDIPGSAVWVDEVGAIDVGDFFAFTHSLSVGHDGAPSFVSIDGELPNGRTFGNDVVPTPTLYTIAERNSDYMTAGRFVTGVDLVRTFWQGFDDGTGGGGVLQFELNLIAEAGTLVDESGRILAESPESFAQRVIGAHVRLSYPNAILSDAFLTDPELRFVPSPATLAVLLGPGLLACRRRR